MMKIDNTLSELKVLESYSQSLKSQFDGSLKTFLDKFNTTDEESEDKDETSLELEETFFRLLDARNALDHFENLISSSRSSLDFVKNNAPPRFDAGFFVTRHNLHKFLYDSVDLGKEDEWFLIFEKTPTNLSSKIYYMDGRILSKVSLYEIMEKTHKNKKEGSCLNENDFFDIDCWVEKEAELIIMPDGKLIKIIG